MEKSKQNKHIVCNKDKDGDNGVDNSVDNGDDDVVDVDDDSANQDLTYLSQVTDCCLMERSKQTKHIACNKDNDCDYGVED
eukprot:37753-Ditylum_brightwellii.AAC.1